MNKTQLIAIEKTISDRLKNYFQQLSKDEQALLAPSRETRTLQKDYSDILKKVEKHNEKVAKSGKMGHQLHVSYNSTDVELREYGTVSVTIPGTQSFNSMYVTPTIAPKAQKAADAMSDYMLQLTLGTETVDGLNDFLKNLLK